MVIRQLLYEFWVTTLIHYKSTSSKWLKFIYQSKLYCFSNGIIWCYSLSEVWVRGDLPWLSIRSYMSVCGCFSGRSYTQKSPFHCRNLCQVLANFGGSSVNISLHKVSIWVKHCSSTQKLGETEESMWQMDPGQSSSMLCSRSETVTFSYFLIKVVPGTKTFWVFSVIARLNIYTCK